MPIRMCEFPWIILSHFQYEIDMNLFCLQRDLLHDDFISNSSQYKKYIYKIFFM